MTKLSERFWEIDFLRGLAVTIMILFHFIFIFYYISNRGFVDVFWSYFGRIASVMFILIAGVSLSLSHFRAKKTE
jgi:uncharacterized membrane protein